MLKHIIMTAVLLIAATAEAQTTADQDALEALPTRFVEAWARHDGHLLAAIMADGIDFITVGGSWFHGKRDFELYHTRLLEGRFREARMTPLERKVNFIRPDLGFVRWSWKIEGDKNFDGSPRPARVGIMSMLAEKQGSEWKVIAAQNTNALLGPAPEEKGITFPITLPNPEQQPSAASDSVP